MRPAQIMSTVLVLGTMFLACHRARADVELRVDGAATVVGNLASPTGSVALVADLAAGTKLTIAAQGIKSDGIAAPLVSFSVFDEDATAVAASEPRGRRARLRGFTTTVSGLHRIVVTGDQGVVGRYKLSAKWKPPRGVKETFELGEEDAVVPFAAAPGSTATISVKAAKGSSALPRLREIRTPDAGSSLAIDAPTTDTARSNRVKKLELPAGGDLELVVGDAGALGGPFLAVIRLRAPRTRRRTVKLTSLALPDGGEGSPVSADALFFAKIAERTGGRIEVDARGADAARFRTIAGAALHLPERAVAKPVVLVVAEATPIVVPEVPLDPVGAAVFFGPADTQFAVAVRVTLSWDPAVFDRDTADLRIYERDGDGTLTLVDPAVYAFGRPGEPMAPAVGFPIGSLQSYQLFAVPATPSEQKVTPATPAVDDYFGGAVSVDGDTLLVGSSGDDTVRIDGGAAFVYTRDGSGMWTEQAKLTHPDGPAGVYNFGIAAALDGDTVVVGAREGFGARAGFAYVFARDAGGIWSLQSRLVSSDAAASDFFGLTVAIDGDTIVVGAAGNDDAGDFSGSAYVFVRDAGGFWNEQAKLVASDAAASDFFGVTVGISSDTVVVGASSADDSGIDSGTVYVFTRDGDGMWSEQAKLIASDGVTGAQFGASLGIDGDSVVVGAERVSDFGLASGAAYVFARDGVGIWSQVAKLRAADPAPLDLFGNDVDISGHTVVVGSWYDDDDDDAATTRSGSVYVFAPNAGGAWVQRLKIANPDPTVNDWFGDVVAIDGDTILVGQGRDDDASGAVFIYDLDP